MCLGTISRFFSMYFVFFISFLISSLNARALRYEASLIYCLVSSSSKFGNSIRCLSLLALNLYTYLKRYVIYACIFAKKSL